jgi:precorrin-3B synthase
MSATDSGTTRTRPDRCPGVLRPWVADDGGLVRVRVPGGRVPVAALAALGRVSEEYGDGRVHATARANLQVRGLPLVDGALPAEVVAAVEATGLLPSRAHDLARNVLCSPLSGVVGGLADLRPVVAALDAEICESAALAGLPGRFLFVLDDGRGDVVARQRDLGLVAVGRDAARVLVGRGSGEVVALGDAAAVLTELAEEFVRERGTGPDAAWHVDELPEFKTRRATTYNPARHEGQLALPYGPVAGTGLTHVEVGADGIDRQTIAAWAARTAEVVVTPWHGVLV